jgi:hypothetical protein
MWDQDFVLENISKCGLDRRKIMLVYTCLVKTCVTCMYPYIHTFTPSCIHAESCWCIHVWSKPVKYMHSYIHTFTPLCVHVCLFMYAYIYNVRGEPLSAHFPQDLFDFWFTLSICKHAGINMHSVCVRRHIVSIPPPPPHTHTHARTCAHTHARTHMRAHTLNHALWTHISVLEETVEPDRDMPPPSPPFYESLFPEMRVAVWKITSPHGRSTCVPFRVCVHMHTAY